MAINKLKTLSALALAFGTQVATASADELTTQVDTILTKVSEKITASEKTNITDLVQEISDNVELEINSLELTDAEKAELAIQVQDQILQYSKEENTDSVFMQALAAKIESFESTPIAIVDPIAEEPVELTEHTVEETKSPTEIVEVLETEPVLDPEVEIDTTPQTATETSTKVYTTQKEIDAKSGTYYYNKDKVKGTAVEITEAEAKKLGLAHSLLDGEKPAETTQVETPTEAPAETQAEKPAETLADPAEKPAEKPAETKPSTDTTSSTSTTNTNPANAQVSGAGTNPGTTSSSSKESSSTASSTTASNAPTATSSTASNSSANPNTSRSVSPSVTSQTTSSTTSSTQDSLPVTGDTQSNLFSFVGVAMLAAAGLSIKKQRKEL